MFDMRKINLTMANEITITEQDQHLPPQHDQPLKIKKKKLNYDLHCLFES